MMKMIALGDVRRVATWILSYDFSVISDYKTVSTLPVIIKTSATKSNLQMNTSPKNKTAKSVANSMPVAVLLVRSVISANGSTTKFQKAIRILIYLHA